MSIHMHPRYAITTKFKIELESALIELAQKHQVTEIDMIVYLTQKWDNLSTVTGRTRDGRVASQ